MGFIFYEVFFADPQFGFNAMNIVFNGTGINYHVKTDGPVTTIVSSLRTCADVTATDIIVTRLSI